MLQTYVQCILESLVLEYLYDSMILCASQKATTVIQPDHTRSHYFIPMFFASLSFSKEDNTHKLFPGPCGRLDPVDPLPGPHREGHLHLRPHQGPRGLQERGGAGGAQWQHHDTWMNRWWFPIGFVIPINYRYDITP